MINNLSPWPMKITPCQITKPKSGVHHNNKDEGFPSFMENNNTVGSSDLQNLISSANVKTVSNSLQNNIDDN